MPPGGRRFFCLLFWGLSLSIWTFLFRIVCLFDDQIILYGRDPFDAPCDFNRFVDGLLGINEAAQLDLALERLDTDLK
jgi:hypothetical protein